MQYYTTYCAAAGHPVYPLLGPLRGPGGLGSTSGGPGSGVPWQAGGLPRSVPAPKQHRASEVALAGTPH